MYIKQWSMAAALTIVGLYSELSAPNACAQHSSAPFEPEIAAFEKHDQSSPPPRGAFLFVGSSSFRLWKDLETAFLPKQVINRGFGGSEIRDSTFFADRIITPYHPRMVVLYAGDNDIAAGRAPADVLEDFKQFVATVRGGLPGEKIAFVSIKPSPSRWKLVSQTREANDLIRNYIRNQKKMVYINIFDAMLGPDDQPRPQFYKADKLHPTDAAYAAWRRIIGPFLK